MVAVALLLFLIIGVGVIFKSASSAVGLSEATGSIFAQVRAINQQLESDIHGINKSGFLVIRCRAEKITPTVDTDYDPNNFRFRRYDQISFISTGKFTSRTGAWQSNNLFADTSTSNIARVWYGQLYVEKDSPASNQATAVGANYPPTSLVGPHAPAGASTPTLASLPLDPTYEGGFLLGRQAMLLLNPPPAAPPANSVYPAGYTSIGYSPTVVNTMYAGTPGVSNAGVESATVPWITSSRLDVAYTTLSQEMTNINNGTYAGAALAQRYCYRLKVLPSPNQTAVGGPGTPYLPNGIFRTHPVLAKGVASFAVDWTDGTTDGNKNLNWYGLNKGSAGSYAVDSTATTPNSFGGTVDNAATNIIPSDPNGVDSYCAIFKPSDAASWPKALRFSYRITDSNDRLSGGRTFVCVIDLP